MTTTTNSPGRGARIDVEGISKSFGETKALAGVDMSVPAGTVQGLPGPNGAGKTTLVRILATLLADGHGGLARTLPEGESAASVVAKLLPAGARYVKAFGTVGAGELGSAARSEFGGHAEKKA
jgi:ABC-type lipopolysaccharide export system ATPase subunit